MKRIEIQKDILSAFEEKAKKNKELFKNKNIYVLNLMSGPGAGKTTLLERTVELMKDTFRLGVIEGDIATTRDAERIRAQGIEVVQINTGGACHLDSVMIRSAVVEFDFDELDVLIIENVGNLVCPAEFDLGEDAKVMILSVTEGEDKPLKYPLMFRMAKVLVVNKIDLLPYVDCRVDKVMEDAKSINPGLICFEISCTKKSGLGPWKEWLEGEIIKKKNESAAS